jgi:NodT family efflux transporter outer membrane factor (OMF) lipoprotein
MNTGHLRRTATLIASLTLLLNACTTLGPDYEEPEVAWLSDWQSDLYGQLGAPEQQTAVDLSFWWRLFNDPVLNDLIETARRENPSLRIAGLRILESRAFLGIASSNRYPQLQQANASATYVNNELKGGQVDDRSQNYEDYRASFDVGWELDFWGRFRRGIESAEAGFLASITAQQDVQVLLSAQVADLYFTYRTTQLRIDIARENAAIQKRSFEITERIYEAGEGSELDLQQAKTQYLATLSTIPDLEATLIQTRNALAAVLGRPPGDVPELVSVSESLPTIERVVIQDIPTRLLLRRPDIRTAAWQIAVQSAQIGIAEADYYPAITLLGSIGWSSDTLGPTPDILSAAGGPALKWNVFDYGRIRNNVRLQDARLQQSIEAFQDSVLQAAREIDDAAIRVIKTREQQGILSDALRAAERSLELANTRYQEGYADFQRVLEAQRALFAQAEQELLNQGAHVSAVIGLYRAIGGGWHNMPVEQLVPESVRETMRARTRWGDLLSAPLPAGADGPSNGSETSR